MGRSVMRSAEMKSSQYGIPTTYVQIVHYASLDPSFAVPPMPVACKRHGRTFPSGCETSTVSEIQQTEVQMIIYGDATFFFAWLSPECFNNLKSVTGEVADNALLVSWLSSLVIEDAPRLIR